ncbi:MAG: hypothetical protein ACRCZS_25980 [Chroococcidiopsis sp.]
MEVFTKLGDRALTGEELGQVFNLHPRGIFDFFDALVALGFLSLCCHSHEKIMEEKRRKHFSENDRTTKSCTNSQICR